MDSYSFLAADKKYATRYYNEIDSTVPNLDRDKNRILFSKEFRRLDGKTQVFIDGYDDHIRNRLTHTLEVSLLSQIIADLFGFNRTLIEAIALGHDVGHTPFGHVGERVLNHLTNNCDPFKDFMIDSEDERGFKHNWQGIKVVSTLEKVCPDFHGLNLTDFTLWGILNHSKLNYKPCAKIDKGKCNYKRNGVDCHLDKKLSLSHYNKYAKFINNQSWTFEASIVGLADEIAQRHHDIEDGLIAGIIDRKDLIERFENSFKLFLKPKELTKLKNLNKLTNLNFFIHDFSSFLLNFYINNLLSNSLSQLKQFVKTNKLKNELDFYQLKKSYDYKNGTIISFSAAFEICDEEFQNYLYTRVLNSHLAQMMDGKATYILNNLIKAYLSNPKQLPDGTIIILFNNLLPSSKLKQINSNNDTKIIAGNLRGELDKFHASSDNHYKTQLIRTVTDFIAGMTDSFAISQYTMLYGSNNYWKK